MNARGRAGRSSQSELEHEWQFDADDLGAVRDWLESRLDDPDETPDGRLALLSAGSDELTDVYLDTHGAGLLHGGWSLRHRMARSLSPADSGREEGERLRRVLTLKATRSEGGELRVRREIHEALTPIDDDALDTQSRLAVAAAHAARGEIGATMGALMAGEALRPFCLVVTARRRYTLESLDGPCAEIALDDANVLPVAATNGDRSHDAPPTVSRPVSLQRVEIELAPRLGRPGDPSAVADRAAVDAFVERFARDVELSPAHASKLEIGLRAAGRKLDDAEAPFGGLDRGDDDDDDDDDDDEEGEDAEDDEDDEDDDLDDDAPDEDESDGEMEVEPDSDELDEDDVEFARTLRRIAPQPNLVADSADADADAEADAEGSELDELADDGDAADEAATDHRSRRQAPKPASSSSIDALLDAIRASRAESAAPEPETRRSRKAEPGTAKRGPKPVAAQTPIKRKRARSPERKPKRSTGKQRTGRTERTAAPSVPVHVAQTAAPRTAPPSNAIGEIGALVLGADASATELAYVTLRRLYVALRGYEPGTRLGEDREELHQMRVATRRTRASLSFFADALPLSGERFNAAWRRVGQSLGAVRDLDVLALELQARLAAVDRTAAAEEKAGTSAGLNAVLAGLERRRRLLRRRMIERLDRVKTARLFRAYEQFLHAGEARASEDGELSAALFLPERLRRRRRKLQRALRGLASTSPVGEFHQARILGKRLRYAVEFSNPIYGAVARAYARRLVPLQDLLGQVQDASIAFALWNDPRLASSLPSEGLVALGRLIEQARSESKRGRRRVRRRARLVRGKAWRALRREVAALAAAATRDEPGL